MYLIQILLPLYENSGRAIPEARFKRFATELTERFGGLTTYTHAPAEGLWKRRGKRAARDQIIVYEAMSKRLGRTWWARKRAELERDFRQQRVVIRALRITTL